MLVTVHPPRRGTLSQLDSKFALQQDLWNDYSFQTLYHLYYQPNADDRPTLIGPCKILKRGQTKSDGLQITEAFERLSDAYCSVGAALDYYQRLRDIARVDRDEIVEKLRDVVANPALKAEFESEEGWGVSLFRGERNPDSYLEDAHAIYSGSFGTLKDISPELTFQAQGWSSPLQLDFSDHSDFDYFGRKRKVGPSKTPVLLPRRIIVLVGRNGSGKSTLLAKLARVAHASPSERSLKHIRRIGAFNPSSIGFTRVIAVSYSAFDSFILPGVFDKDLEQMSSDVAKGAGRYSFVGLRDLAAEAEDDLQRAEKKVDETKRHIVDDQERRTTTKLKSLDQLAREFSQRVREIKDNGDWALFEAALEPAIADPSFAEVFPEALAQSNTSREMFLRWSTGHKIAMHVIASLVAHAEKRSLILFDEPEAHLHPPLTAALMNSVRVILEEKNALAVVATHSPVVIQETLARHVRVVSREGDTFNIRAPGSETFGENVGRLTQDVFGLTSSVTDYHSILDLLIDGCSSLEEVNAFFTPELSGQALAYVMAGLARKRKKS